jgi:hypothetical protein
MKSGAKCERGETPRRAGIKVLFREERGLKPDRPYQKWPVSISAGAAHARVI